MAKDYKPKKKIIFSNGEEYFTKAVEKLKTLFSRYNLNDLAYALLIIELWLPNISNTAKFPLYAGLLSSIDDSKKPSVLLNNYVDFCKFCEELINCSPKFNHLEDFVPETDWGDIRIPFKNKFFNIFYGTSIERIYDFIKAFEITICSGSEFYASNLSRNPILELEYVLHLQDSFIQSLKNQPIKSNLNDRLNPGHIEIPMEEFWESARKFFLALNLKERLPKDFLNNFSISSGAKSLDGISLNSFSNDIFSDSWINSLFLKNNDEYIPLNPRNFSSNFMLHWYRLAEKYNYEYKSQTLNSLQEYMASKFATFDGVFKTILVIHKNHKQKPIPFDFVLISNNKIFLVKLLDQIKDPEDANLENYLPLIKKVFDSMNSWEFPTFYIPSKEQFLELSRENYTNSTDEIDLLFLFQLNSYEGLSIGIPEDFNARVMSLDSFLGIVDTLRSTKKIADYFEFIDSNENAMGPFIGTSDLLGAFVDSDGILEEGAIKFNMIAIDPHWGSNFRFKVLSERNQCFPEMLPDDSAESWICEKVGPNEKPVLRRSDKSILSTHVLWGKTNLFTISDYTEIEPAEGYLMEALQECLVDVFSSRDDILTSFHIESEFTKIVLNLSVGTKVPDPNSNEAEGVGKPRFFVDPYLVCGSKVIENDYLELNIEVDFFKVHSSIHMAKDATFEILILKEILSLTTLDWNSELYSELSIALDLTKTWQPRFITKTQERPVPFPDFSASYEPERSHFKLAKKELALTANKIGFKEGFYELEEAKLLLNKLKSELIDNLNSKLSNYDTKKSIPFVLECIESLQDKEWRSETKIEQSMIHEVDYDRAKVHGIKHDNFLRNHKNYRYLIEKFIELSPKGKVKLTNKSFQEIIAFIDWIFVIYGASDSLHYGIHTVGLRVHNDITLSVEYDQNIETKEAEFRQKTSENHLNIRGNLNDIVSYEGDRDALLDSIDSEMKAEIGFRMSSLLVVMEGLMQWANIQNLNPPLTFYYARKDEIRVAINEIDSDFNIEELNQILNFLTLTRDGLTILSGETERSIDIPVWEHTKRKQRYTITPLIKIENYFFWGAYSMKKARSIWSNSILKGTLPSEYKLTRTKQLLQKVKSSIESSLVSRTHQIIKRFTSLLDKEVFLDKRFPNSAYSIELGDYDVLAYLPDANILLSVECKDNNPPYCLKDSKRLRERIFGRNQSESSHVQKILRRHANLLSRKADVIDDFKWNSKDVSQIKVISLYVSRLTFWWSHYPPYPIVVEFVQIDELDDFLKNLIK